MASIRKKVFLDLEIPPIEKMKPYKYFRLRIHWNELFVNWITPWFGLGIALNSFVLPYIHPRSGMTLKWKRVEEPVEGGLLYQHSWDIGAFRG
jgi:hypothetical protein